MLKSKPVNVVVRRIRENYPLAVVDYVFPCPHDDCPIEVKGNIFALLSHLSKHGLSLADTIDMAREVVSSRLAAINEKREQNKNRFVTNKTDFLKRKR